MHRLKLIPLIGISSLLSACEGSMADLDLFIHETKQAHHGTVEPLPEFPEYQMFAYDAVDSRDPFRPQTDAAGGFAASDNHVGPSPEATRRREPLESYPVDALKMVGLLQQKKQIWGLVRDPDGTIHRVQPGNYAGQNHGKIIQVSDTKIHIVELVPDGLSGWVNREAQLAMAED
jgi:type IV pilus assembly protein PilP